MLLLYGAKYTNITEFFEKHLFHQQPAKKYAQRIPKLFHWSPAQEGNRAPDLQAPCQNCLVVQRAANAHLPHPTYHLTVDFFWLHVSPPPPPHPSNSHFARRVKLRLAFRLTFVIYIYIHMRNKSVKLYISADPVVLGGARPSRAAVARTSLWLVLFGFRTQR